MSGISALVKEAPEASLVLLPHENAVKRTLASGVVALNL